MNAAVALESELLFLYFSVRSLICLGGSIIVDAGKTIPRTLSIEASSALAASGSVPKCDCFSHRGSGP